MKHTRISKEEAARLAQRDRNRIIGLAIVAALVGGLYLYSDSNAQRKRDQQDAELASAAPSRELEAKDIAIIPFDRTDVLEEIKDATEAGQELLQTEPLKLVFDYARLQTATALGALGLRDLEPAQIAALIEAPATHRLEAYRARGVILEAGERPRANGIGNDWKGSMRLLSGEVVHFLVANAPKQPGGQRLIEAGDYLRVEGLFYGLHRTTVDPDGPSGEEGAKPVTAPLIVGAKASPSTPQMTTEVAQELASLDAVVDDSIGVVHDSSQFAQAKWELMGKALMLGNDTNWDAAPELNAEILRKIYEDGEAYRGKPFTLSVSINMDANALGAGDNPLRIDDYTDGWISNILWKKPVHVIHWQAPFKRTDLLRDNLLDENRYVTAKGYFFRNEVYETSAGEPARTPLFIMHSVEVFTPPKDPSIAWFGYGVLGLTIGLIVLIYILLQSAKRKSKALYEDMLRRKRTRRGKQTHVTPA